MQLDTANRIVAFLDNKDIEARIEKYGDSFAVLVFTENVEYKITSDARLSELMRIADNASGL